MSKVFIDGRTLTYEDVVAVARGYKSVDIASEVRDQVERTRRVLEDILAQDRVIYGVNTGFGHLASVRISDEELCKLQENLIISHAAGTGDPFPDEVVRAMILLRANSLARGDVYKRQLLDARSRQHVHPSLDPDDW